MMALFGPKRDVLRVEDVAEARRAVSESDEKDGLPALSDPLIFQKRALPSCELQVCRANARHM